MSDWLDAEAHADRALEMFERGRWSEAESELRKAIELNPQQAEWHYNLGLTIEAAGRDSEALDCFARTAAMMPDQVEPAIAAGNTALRLSRFREAIDWFGRALRVDPRHEGAYAGTIDAHVRLEEHEEAETTFYLSQQALESPSGSCLAAIARSLVDREDWDRAAWCLREALQAEPTIPRLRAMLAFVLAAQGQQQRAVQLYLRELREDPGNADTLLDYGELLVDMGRFAEGAEKFRRVLELEPANVEAHERLGWIAMRQGRDEQAHLEYELVLKLDPDFPGIRLSLAEVLIRRGMLEDARRTLGEELEHWLEASPSPSLEDDPVDRFARLLLDADLAVEAVRLLEATEAARSDRPEILRALALARFRTGDGDGGCAASRRVLRYESDCVVSMHNMALHALEAGQLQIAAGWIHRGLRVDPHDAGLRQLRMRLYVAVVRGVFARWRGRGRQGGVAASGGRPAMRTSAASRVTAPASTGLAGASSTGTASRRPR
ncbi:MAG: tetratricopeptide repeat protein [Planctomycetota bacterium]